MALIPIPRQAFNIDKAIPVHGYRKAAPGDLIDLAIESRIARIIKRFAIGGDDPFFVADLGQIVRQHRRWIQNMPGIRPFYAVKCNCDPTFLKVLADLGTGFDCASIEEMRAVLNLGVDPGRILFANPCKAPAAVAFAREVGVLRTTFDNIDELDTIKAHMPDAQLLLRIYANDEEAFICLGEKFGAHLDTTEELLARAWELGLNVVGVSFHVGTGATNPASFCNAIKDARLVFQQAERLGFHPKILDIGGGFQDNCFESMAPIIRDAIRAEFPAGTTVVAEPGRFYARSVYTLVCRVISRRRQLGSAAASGIPDMLYQNDGIYGNFMNVIMEKEIMKPHLLKAKKSKAANLGNPRTSEISEKGNEMTKSTEHRYSIWGPTCDSTDCVAREVSLENEVKVGDWFKYKDMGAYTSTTATQFNGFSSECDIIYVNSEALPDV
ncbi:uncharacterized protein N7506_011680 [Penicillium brevicompactum]|uniref:uncharacterized protein n=1 Tax=Penicillium brevicompactum TaxID=5074 RepID=UPI002540DBA4|nr:uncharacterized protein N7506_011680 [Penicillium brevicompactum]KAJ5318976.1 hypothetical protein N7506_011680 [Penicillium brevicompactum]